jgi:hypothetical protein
MNSKKIFIIALLAIISYKVSAQKEAFSLRIGTGLSSFSDSKVGKSTFGLGADVLVRTSFSDKVQGFAQTGYNAFINNGFNVAYIPLVVGLNMKVNGFTPGIGIGYASSTAGGSTIGGFTVSPQIGYQINKLELLANFNSTNVTSSGAGTWNIFGVKVFYKIN